MTKMEEETIKVVATPMIRVPPTNHLCMIAQTAENDTRENAQDHWVF